MAAAIFSEVQVGVGQFYGRVGVRISLNVPQRELSYQTFDEEQELKSSIGLV